MLIKQRNMHFAWVNLFKYRLDGMFRMICTLVYPRLHFQSALKYQFIEQIAAPVFIFKCFVTL